MPTIPERLETATALVETKASAMSVAVTTCETKASEAAESASEALASEHASEAAKVLAEAAAAQAALISAGGKGFHAQMTFDDWPFMITKYEIEPALNKLTIFARSIP